MPAETNYIRCDECGIEFGFICEQEVCCPGCGHWMEFGHDCSCGDCRADDATEAAVQRIAAAVQIPVATVHAVLEMLTASTS
ncbi:hypothetical protein Mal15_28550 [Stieleria maiorica]|uniref:Uncharacterized protein n=1 Tax=Stieleria maiorica TaxID=2795974 RepID=A0A5B9ME52_9BACT|nr:hypothetical protein [Stieleria maiorica]QEF98799.1 hypothetical protein Mal15_28550 [Stieleria maiorica]